MAYENGGCGPFEDAKLNTAYRGLYISPLAVTDPVLTVESNSQEQTLPLTAGFTFSGRLVIKDVLAGSLADIKGYIP
jgi:hypothetical protein